VNKIAKSKKGGAGTNDLKKSQLVWFDILRWFLWGSLSSEAIVISVGILHAPNWFLFLIHWFT
jgi:hypothetical protein